MTTEREMQHQHGGNMDAQIENVLEAYTAAEPGPSRAALAAWMREYPQFAHELIEFTARWRLLEWAGDPATSAEADVTENSDVAANSTADDVFADEEERLILRGMSAAQSVFYATRAKRQAAPKQEAKIVQTPIVSVSTTPATLDAPITNLLAAATLAGLSYADLRDRAGLSDGLLRKIDRRLIDPLTIPARVLSDLAVAVRRTVAVVTTYTRLAPAFGADAQYRARQTPALPEQREDFFEAVQADLTIDESRRRDLLALPRPSCDDQGRIGQG